MNIEETMFTDALPVSSQVTLNRLEELMAHHNTNCLSDCKEDWRVRAALWLLNSQVFGQLDVIDMNKLGDSLRIAAAAENPELKGI